MSEVRARFRKALDSGLPVIAPFVYDGLTAHLARAAGFDAVYMTGFGTAAARGYPDLGLLTMSEMVDNVRVVARSSELPVICDADTGYGNPINVWRTVQEYEAAGAAALHIEDQVWPKRCGFMAGKQVVPMETMLPKIRAACDARRDPDTIIIARTDALTPLGWPETERRARAYRDAGADLIFVDGITRLEDLRRYSDALGDLPLLYNGHLVPLEKAGDYRFRVIIHTATLFTAYVRLRDAYRELQRTGTIVGAPGFEILPEITEILGAKEILERAERYKE